MDTDSVAQPAAVHWQIILQLAFPHLQLADIWCLSLTSKAAAEFCRDKLADGCCQQARDLLFSAVAAKACMPAQACCRKPWMRKLALQTPVEWLLDANVIPPEFLALDSTRYLCINEAPYRENLLDAGLKITYEAVVTAARKLRKHLCEWILDCDAWNLALEINSITRAACCSDKMEMDLNFLSTPDIILDHLYISVNCISYLPSISTSSACMNIINICRLPAAAEVTAEAIEPLLHAAVQVLGKKTAPELYTTILNYDHESRAAEALCRLDATNRLSNAALCGLLKASAETLPTNEMLPLFQLSAVRQLAPAQKVEVILTLSRSLLAADSARDALSFAIFANMLDELVPGIPEASRASLFRALFVLSTQDTTANNRAAWVAFGVMGTPGMKDFSTAMLQELLWYVLEGGAKDPRLPETVVASFLGMLCKWPVAAELGVEAVAQLLQQAWALSYSSETIDKLLQIKAAQRQSNQ